MLNSKGENFTDDHFKAYLQEPVALIKDILVVSLLPRKHTPDCKTKQTLAHAQYKLFVRLTKNWSCWDNSHIGRKLVAIFLAYCPPMSRKLQKWYV